MNGGKWRAFALSVGVGVAAAGTVVGAAQLRSDPPATPADTGSASATDGRQQENGISVVQPGEPCPIAVRAPLAELAGAADLPIWLPVDGLARVTDGWACGLGNAPVLMFGEIQVSYEAGWHDVDLDKKWASYIAAYGGHATDLAGLSVLVHDGNEVAPNNEVMVVKGDTLIRLLSLGDVPVEDLVKLVKSFDLEHPAYRPDAGVAEGLATGHS